MFRLGFKAPFRSLTMTERLSATSAQMSAFGAKADVEWCRKESLLLTQNGHSVRGQREEVEGRICPRFIVDIEPGVILRSDKMALCDWGTRRRRASFVA